jgi:hypothetical protein
MLFDIDQKMRKHAAFFGAITTKYGYTSNFNDLGNPSEVQTQGLNAVYAVLFK